MLGRITEERWTRFAPWLLVALGLLLLIPGTAMLPLLDRDEPRFAGATVEMMQRDEWIVPYFNGVYRFDKPVLTYWLMRGGYALFGIGELGARAHSVAAAILLALAIWHFGRRWFSARVGFLAAAMMLGSLQFLVHGRSAVADMPMALCVALAQFALFELLQGFTWRRFWLLYLALGFGFLAKGPIAWAVPLLGALLHRFAFLRAPQPWRNLRLPLGLPIVLALVAAWGIPALLATHGEFWKVGMGEHIVKRGFEAFDGRKFVPFYYLPTALFSLFPWIAFLGAAWAVVRQRWGGKQAFLVAWLLAPYLVFSFYSTQLPHYVLPAFPAFFLILAQAFDGAPLKWPRWAAGWTIAVFALGGVLVAALFSCAAWAHSAPAPYDALARIFAGFGELALGLLAGAWALHCRRPALAASGLVLAALGLGFVGAAVRPLLPAVTLQPLFARLPPETEFLSYRFREPTLVFYSRRKWTAVESVGELAAAMKRPGPRLIVVTEEQRDADDFLNYSLARWLGRPADFKYGRFAAENAALDRAGYTHLLVEGLNVARGQWVVLRVAYRGAAD